MPIEPVNDLPKPFVWETVIDIDDVRDLAKLLVSEPAKDNEPVSVRDRKACSARVEDIASVPVSDLYIEECSTRLDTTFSDPVSVLKNEECSARAEDKPSEPDRILGKLLISEPAVESEPVNVFDSETCSVRAVEEPREPFKNMT